MYEYKVVRISTSGKWTQNKKESEVEEAEIEATVNELAGQGWRLISTSAHDFQMLDIVDRATLVLFFERETS